MHHLHILSLLLNKVGTETHSYEEFNELMNLNTSGLSMAVLYDGHPDNFKKIDGFVILNVGCLDRNVPKMFELLTDLLTNPDFKDFEHISKLIRLESSDAANKIVERPLEFAVDYGTSSQRPAQQFYNKLENVS